MHNVLIILQRELHPISTVPLPCGHSLILLMVGGFSLYFLIFCGWHPRHARIFFACGLFLLLISPSACAFAEEIRTGSIELLVTMPIRDEVCSRKVPFRICGGLLPFLTLSYPITFSVGDMDWGPIIGGYIGLALPVPHCLHWGCCECIDQVISFYWLLVCLWSPCHGRV